MFTNHYIDIFGPWILSSFEAEYIFNFRIWSFYYYFTEYTNFVLSYLRLNDELLDTHLETQSVGIEGFDNSNAKYQSIRVNRNKSMNKCLCNKLMKTNTTLSEHLQNPIEKS